MFSYLFSHYSWIELFRPFFLLFLVGFGLLYYRSVFSSPLYKIQKYNRYCFIVAMILLYIVKGSPLHVIGKDILFSVHILSLASIHFIIIPLFLLSFPTELLRKWFWDYRLRMVVRFFSHPWIAALIFNGMLTVYLIPKFFNYIHGHWLLSYFCQSVLVITAILMWWTIIAPLKEVGRFSYFIRVAYVFLNSLLLMPMGIFLILSIFTPHYHIYDAANYQMFENFNGIQDQQLGGAILKSLQLLGYGTALFYLITRWAKAEENKEDERYRVVQGVVIFRSDQELDET